MLFGIAAFHNTVRRHKVGEVHIWATRQSHWKLTTFLQKNIQTELSKYQLTNYIKKKKIPLLSLHFSELYILIKRIYFKYVPFTQNYHLFQIDTGSMFLKVK